MDPDKRVLLKVRVPAILGGAEPDHKEALERKSLDATVETLMGRKPELRFAYIQENARFVEELDV